MMALIQSRFGEIDYNPEETILFPRGLLGFESLRHFVVMPNRKQGPLFWIQSTEDPDIAFVMTDPTGFFLDYRVSPDGEERKLLGLKDDDECFVLSVVTVSPDRQVTLNLCAPVLYSPKTNRALQVILEEPKFSTKTPLPTVDKN